MPKQIKSNLDFPPTPYFGSSTITTSWVAMKANVNQAAPLNPTTISPAKVTQSISNQIKHATREGRVLPCRIDRTYGTT